MNYKEFNWPCWCGRFYHSNHKHISPLPRGCVLGTTAGRKASLSLLDTALCKSVITQIIQVTRSPSAREIKVWKSAFVDKLKFELLLPSHTLFNRHVRTGWHKAKNPNDKQYWAFPRVTMHPIHHILFYSIWNCFWWRLKGQFYSVNWTHHKLFYSILWTVYMMRTEELFLFFPLPFNKLGSVRFVNVFARSLMLMIFHSFNQNSRDSGTARYYFFMLMTVTIYSNLWTVASLKLYSGFYSKKQLPMKKYHVLFIQQNLYKHHPFYSWNSLWWRQKYLLFSVAFTDSTEPLNTLYIIPVINSLTIIWWRQQYIYSIHSRERMMTQSYSILLKEQTHIQLILYTMNQHISV